MKNPVAEITEYSVWEDPAPTDDYDNYGYFVTELDRYFSLGVALLHKIDTEDRFYVSTNENSRLLVIRKGEEAMSFEFADDDNANIFWAFNCYLNAIGEDWRIKVRYSDEDPYRISLVKLPYGAGPNLGFMP